jgi:hypothetical protein
VLPLLTAAPTVAHQCWAALPLWCNKLDGGRGKTERGRHRTHLGSRCSQESGGSDLWRWRSPLPRVDRCGCSSEVLRWLWRAKRDHCSPVVLTDSRNLLERQQNDAATRKLGLGGGGRGNMVGAALHRSFYRGKSPGAFPTTF